MTRYPEQIAGLIAGLEKARRYPGVLFREATVQTVSDTLSGLITGLSAWLGDSLDTRFNILAERGWPTESAYHPSHFMIERGLTPAEVIDELIVIEIETLRRISEG
jgi:hypothetical protein